MKTLLASLSLVFLFLTGCAGFNATKGDLNNAYAREDLDELLHFGADMANMTASSRAEVCRSLLDRQKEAPGAGIQLHLMTGRMLSDACGDIGKILEGADSAPMKNLSDEQVRWLVAAQTEALKRMGDLSRKPSVQERKPKAVRCLPESKKRKPESKKAVPNPQKEAPELQKDDSGLLREKLDAIRSMEKKLDETGTGN